MRFEVGELCSMFDKNKCLVYDVDLHNAMIMGASVIVWQEGIILDYGGQIQRYDDEVVVINDQFFVRSACEFKVKSP